MTDAIDVQDFTAKSMVAKSGDYCYCLFVYDYSHSKSRDFCWMISVGSEVVQVKSGKAVAGGKCLGSGTADFYMQAEDEAGKVLMAQDNSDARFLASRLCDYSFYE